MKIYIKGFKSIRDGQFVAIGNRLTFLVGPNSAGKSVVLSALERLSGQNAHFKLDMSLIHKSPGAQSIVSASHSLGVEWNIGKIKYGIFATYFTDDIAYSVDASVQRNIHQSKMNSVMVPGDDYEILPIKESERLSFRQGIHVNSLLSLGLDKVKRYEFHDGRRRIPPRLVEDHQIFIDFQSIDEKIRSNFKEYMNWAIQLLLDCAEKLKLKADETTKNDSKKSLLEEIELTSKIVSEWQYYYSEGLFHWNLFIIKIFVQSYLFSLDRQKNLNIIEKYNSRIDNYQKVLNQKVEASYPGRNFQLSVVSAERGLPSLIDINCHLRANEESDNIFHELMESKVHQEWGQPISSSSTGKAPSLFECVNQALSDSLFTDNGYQIQVEAKAIIDKKLWNDRRDYNTEMESYDTDFLCKLSLTDAHGRNLTFNDVGSGIGYVLPVLIESFRRANEGKIVFLQQPELHLHPALQTNLTDVLVEASANKRIIAETHSEHMILRALKRIRQTTNGTVKDPMLALKPEDVAVNYFEPLPDGSTKVHILRISKDGDFLDRWPNGFFEERGQELFDE